MISAKSLSLSSLYYLTKRISTSETPKWTLRKLLQLSVGVGVIKCKAMPPHLGHRVSLLLAINQEMVAAMAAVAVLVGAVVVSLHGVTVVAGVGHVAVVPVDLAQHEVLGGKGLLAAGSVLKPTIPHLLVRN